jgi:hypothetical protein
MSSLGVPSVDRSGGTGLSYGDPVPPVEIGEWVGDLETAEPVQDVQDAEAVERAIERDEANVLANARAAPVAPTQLGRFGNRLQTESV